MAVYNGAKYLAAQLKSLARQSMAPNRLVVYDDGSVDASLQIVSDWATMTPCELHIVPGTGRLGPGAAFLHALRFTQPGEIFLFCDQDDVWIPSKVERAYRCLTSLDPTRPTLLATSLSIVDESLRAIGVSRSPHQLTFSSAICENVLTGCTMAFNEALRKILIRDVPVIHTMHDWWCYLVAAGVGHVVFDPEPTVMYRQHTSNAIGIGPAGLSAMKVRAARFFSKSRSVRIAQLEELSRLHHDDLLDANAAVLERYLAVRDSHLSRVRAALSLPVKRQKRANEFLTRIAILANRF